MDFAFLKKERNWGRKMIIKEKAIKEKYFDIQVISFVCGMLASFLLKDVSGNIGYFILKIGLYFICLGVSIFIVNRYMQ